MTTSFILLNCKRFYCWWIALFSVTGVDGAVSAVTGDAGEVSIDVEVPILL